MDATDSEDAIPTEQPKRATMRRNAAGDPETVYEPVYKLLELLFFLLFGTLLLAALFLIARNLVYPILQGHA